MEEIDTHKDLFKEDLFELFKQQLKKDMEASGAEADFVNNLPQEFNALKLLLKQRLEELSQQNAAFISNLLYRVDISETQLRNYPAKHPALSFEEVLAELIIKRILQKVVFKKKFSQ